MSTVSKSQDTKAKSLSEALVNSFGAYPIGYAIGILVLPLSVGWLQNDVFTANIFITLVYASLSFVRIFFLRRLFVRLGFDDNFIILGKKGILELQIILRGLKNRSIFVSKKRTFSL